MMCALASIAARDTTSFRQTNNKQELPHEEYQAIALHRPSPVALEIRVHCAKDQAVLLASDLRKLQELQFWNQISSLSISRGARTSNQSQAAAPTLPVQLLTALCRESPNIERLECRNLGILGNPQEFGEWALAASHLTHLTLTLPKSEESCLKWEPVIAALLSSDNLQELRVDWNGTAGSIGLETSRLVLQCTEQRPNAISLNFPLSFESFPEGARWASQTSSNAVFHCASPIQEDSFMRRFFESRGWPILPEACIHAKVGSRQEEEKSSNEPKATKIHVTVPKLSLADPTLITGQLQQLLGNTVQVTPPVIHQLELFLNPHYLKSRYVYSQFPEDLWDVSESTLDFQCAEYRDMVSVLQEGRVLGNDSVPALYEWFSAHPNNLLRLNL